MIVGNSLWHLIVHTDWISKAIMLILFGMSIGIWTIFLCTAYMSYRKKSALKKVLRRLQNAYHVRHLVDIADAHRGSLLSSFLTRAIMHIKMASETISSVIISKDNARTHERIQQSLDQGIDEIIAQEERFMPVLSTSAVISPLLGLLGTVWGLIHAFMSISQAQTADIVTVAPGIAEALLTTLAGLVVAIPAVVMVNYTIAQTASIEQQLVCIADQIMRIVQQTADAPQEDSCGDLVVGVQKELQQ